MGIGRLLMVSGAILLALGLLVTFSKGLPLRLGHLPGDIYVRGKNTTFYFPVVTCVALSALISLVLWLFRR
ncbi:MAG: DUF2905 domain-containing protein [Bryobacteraceae bacterium]